jgi:hypothetical protein
MDFGVRLPLVNGIEQFDVGTSVSEVVGSVWREEADKRRKREDSKIV